MAWPADTDQIRLVIDLPAVTDGEEMVHLDRGHPTVRSAQPTPPIVPLQHLTTHPPPSDAVIVEPDHYGDYRLL
jgi:hypothetical protein